MALWARLYDGNRANKIFKAYFKVPDSQVFAKCDTPLQIDGTIGVIAGIPEMLVQSHEDVIDLRPALPDEQMDGRFDGVCAHGSFKLDVKRQNKGFLKWKFYPKQEIRATSIPEINLK